jgi:aspartate/methionine/tyrosine aminotransferase
MTFNTHVGDDGGSAVGLAGRVSARLAAVSPSATLAIDAKAKAMKTAGIDVIGFGAGEPDFPTPDHIVEAAAAACADQRNHRYTPTAGLPELRAAIAAKTMRDSGYEVEAAQVLVTNGAKHAVFNAICALIDPGDEVLIPAPYWTTYPEVVRLAGGVPIDVPTDEKVGFKVTVDDLDRARSARTKLLIFASPSNPTGAVYDREALTAIGEWALQNGIFVVSDEIYEHLVYGGREQHSMPVLVPELRDRCIVVNGVAKTYAMTGWRVGWMIGPPDVVEAATNYQSHTTSNVSNVAQRAALAALEGGLADVERMRAAFDGRRSAIHAALNEIPGISCVEPEGAFYAFPSLHELLGREVRGRRPASSSELAEIVLDEARVAFVPGEAFAAPGYARFSYALSDEALADGMRRLAELLGDLPA